MKKRPDPMPDFGHLFFGRDVSKSYLQSTAAHWNKPKAEEQLSIYNIPEAITSDFLKVLFPDAVNWSTSNQEYR